MKLTKKVFTVMILLLCSITVPAQQLLLLEDTDSLKARREKTNANFAMLNSLLGSKLTISLSNPANGHVPVLENGVWKNKPIASGNGMIIEDADSNPSFGLVTRLQFDQADGFVISSPDVGRAKVKLLVPWSKVSKSAQDILDTLGPTPMINCSACTGITGATGGVQNIGSTTIAADTDADGEGVVDILTRGLSRLRVENNGVLTAPDGSGLGNLNGANISSETVERDRFGRYYLRNLQSIIGKIRTGTTAVANIIWLGDSIAQIGNVYNPLNGMLKWQLGDAGPGFLRFDSTNAVYGTFKSLTGIWSESSQTSAARGIHCNSVNSTQVGAIAGIGGGACLATSIDVIYVKQPGGGSFQVSVDGGAYGSSVNTAASLGIGVHTISGLTYGTHSVDVKVVAAGTAGVGLTGANFKVDNVPGVRFHLAANTGSLASQFASMNVTTFQEGIAALNPTLVLLEWAHNEANNQQAVSTYKASLQSLIDRVRAAAPLADILIVSATDKGIALPTGTQMSDYAVAAADLARSNGTAFIDWYKFMGDWDDANTRGMFDDSAHPSPAGGRYLADLCFSFIADGVGNWHQGGTFAAALSEPYAFAGSMTIPYNASYAQRVIGPNTRSASNLWSIGNFGFDMFINLTNANGLSVGDAAGQQALRIAPFAPGSYYLDFNSGLGSFARLSLGSHGAGVPAVIIKGVAGQVASLVQILDSDNKHVASLGEGLTLYNLKNGFFDGEGGSNFERFRVIPSGSNYQFISDAGGTGTAKPFSFGGAPVGLTHGANVASAATITITGNSFHVTGTTPISGIASTGIPAGTEVTVIFDGAVQLTHSGSLELKGSTNFTTTAKTRCKFLWDGTAWWEIERIQP